ncbi:MAG: homocysteine S-methyltransferase family protein [Treponema sp.]|nr:homocysteine S-methyltransferase family protein [Treponema sp.]
MNLKEFAEENILVLDGAMGTQLQKYGLKMGESPEFFNISQSEIVKQVHMSYLQAGSNMILTNTFGANKRKLRDLDSDEVIKRAVDAAKSAVAKSAASNIYTALDIGPIGELLEPMGTLKFDEAYELFAQQVLTGVKEGADVIYIETMTDLYEAKCAVLAAKENTSLPVFCTMSFEKNKRTFVGVSISSAALTLQGLGVDFIGINCSFGPKEMYEMAQELIKWTNLPIVIKPNAGLPKFINGQAVFDIDPGEFADNMNCILDLGISVIGGCCGTTPEFIEKLAILAKEKKPVKRKPLDFSAVCSASKTVLIDQVKNIGECINPAGKERFQTAILENDMDYIVSQAIEQTESGADILDVNTGMPKIDEEKIMIDVIKNIQAVVSVPLQIESTKPEVIEAGLRAYNGKAIVNSVNGDDSSLHTILPIVKKYGAAVIGLTIDQNGNPKTAEERLKIAEKIINTAASYGIPKHDVIIDCLTLTSDFNNK